MRPLPWRFAPAWRGRSVRAPEYCCPGIADDRERLQRADGDPGLPAELSGPDVVGGRVGEHPRLRHVPGRAERGEQFRSLEVECAGPGGPHRSYKSRGAFRSCHAAVFAAANAGRVGTASVAGGASL